MSVGKAIAYPVQACWAPDDGSSGATRVTAHALDALRYSSLCPACFSEDVGKPVRKQKRARLGAEGGLAHIPPWLACAGARSLRKLGAEALPYVRELIVAESCNGAFQRSVPKRTRNAKTARSTQ
jgi:hypothetical protein